MTARLSLLVFVLAPTIALSQAAWAQPIPLTPAPIVATPIPPPIPVVTAPADMLPPPVTEALLPGHWQLDAYSDDAAQVFQPVSAQRSNLMPPTIPI